MRFKCDIEQGEGEWIQPKGPETWGLMAIKAPQMAAYGVLVSGLTILGFAGLGADGTVDLRCSARVLI